MSGLQPADRRELGPDAERRLHFPVPARDLVHALERASVAALVAAALFQVVSGVLNVARSHQLLQVTYVHQAAWPASTTGHGGCFSAWAASSR